MKKKMGLKEFFTQLPRTNWKLWGPGVAIRRTGEVCPVCAVCNDNRWILDWVSAAQSIGLPIDTARRIAKAADNIIETPTEGRIRRLLLKHCGLEAKQ